MTSFNLPVLPDLPNKKEIRAVFVEAHEILVFVIMGLVLMHVGAALKHHFIDRNDVMFRMTPRFLRGILQRARERRDHLPNRWQ